VIGYNLSTKEIIQKEKKEALAWIIYKLERGIAISTTPLLEVKLLALEFFTGIILNYSKNCKIWGDCRL
jgi:hypothetical protein